MLVDEIGGVHEDGIGWNPQGVYCGECVMITCIGCINADIPDVPRGVIGC